MYWWYIAGSRALVILCTDPIYFILDFKAKSNFFLVSLGTANVIVNAVPTISTSEP